MLGWVGTVTSIIGSFLVAFQIVLVGYCFFLVGSVSWCIVGARKRDGALFTLNAVFMVANLTGLYNAIA